MQYVNPEPDRDALRFAQNAVTRAEREVMIARAAYFRAEHRDFKGGDPVRDWLEAEQEIDSVFHVTD